MNKDLFIHKLNGFRRELAAMMKAATLAKQSPTFDSRYIHVSLEAYDKDGELLGRFHDGDYNKYRYPLTNVRYVYVDDVVEEDCVLHITSREDVATFAATGYLHYEFDWICDESGFHVFYSDLDKLKEQSIQQNKR